MYKNTFLCAAAAFVLCGTICAATVDFRSGTVLAAEITASAPKVSGLNVEFPNPVYARIVFKLHPERKISIHDYALNAYGRNFKAVAIARNNEAWTVDGSAFDNNRDTDRFSLLFALDGSVIGKRNIEELEITPRPESNGRSVAVKFKNLKSGSFSSAGSVPGSGSVVK